MIDWKHLKTMLSTMKQWKESINPLETCKYQRWVGFLQGCLYASGKRTIDEMREDVRQGNHFEIIEQIVNEEVLRNDTTRKE